MKFKDLHDKKESILSQMDAIETAAGDEPMSVGQLEEYNDLQTKLDATVASLNAVGKKNAAQVAAIAASGNAHPSTAPRARAQWPGDDPDEEARIEHVGAMPGAVGGGSDLTSMFTRPRSALSAVDPASLVYRGVETHNEVYRLCSAFGHFLQDVHAASDVGGGVVSERLQALRAQGDGATEHAGARGGFMVQQDFGGMLYDQIMSQSDFLSRSRVVPLSPGSNGIRFWAVDEVSRKTGSRWGGVAGHWTGEAQEIGASPFPKLREVELRLHKIAALMKLPDELMQDAAAAGALFLMAVEDEIRFLVEDAVFRGNGVAKPLGFLNHEAAVTVAKENAQDADTVVWENLSKMFMQMATRSKPRGYWFHNFQLGHEFDKLSVAGVSEDSPRFVDYGPTGLLRIKGRPAIETEYNSALGEVGDLTFTDPSQYIAIVGPMMQAASMHLYFSTDEMAFRLTWRVDGKPGWVQPLEPYQGSLQMSPYVQLAARA